VTSTGDDTELRRRLASSLYELYQADGRLSAATQAEEGTVQRWRPWRPGKA
jgi:hypothetical protein